MPRRPRIPVDLADRVGVALLHEGLHRGERTPPRHRRVSRRSGATPAHCGTQAVGDGNGNESAPMNAATQPTPNFEPTPTIAIVAPSPRRRRHPANKDLPAGCGTRPGTHHRKPRGPHRRLAREPPRQTQLEVAVSRSDSPDLTDSHGSRSSRAAITRSGRRSAGPITAAHAGPNHHQYGDDREATWDATPCRLLTPSASASIESEITPSSSTIRGPHREATPRPDDDSAIRDGQARIPPGPETATVSGVCPHYAPSPRKMSRDRRQ